MNPHNRTHPLIKFRTPVRSVAITTLGLGRNGESMRTMGDELPSQPTSSLTAPAASCETTQGPAGTEALGKAQKCAIEHVKGRVNIKDLLAEPLQDRVKAPEAVVSPTMADLATICEPKVTPIELNAHFMRDSIPDGTKVQSGTLFFQDWTLVNPGPLDWPIGCSVRFAGGDCMLDLPTERPTRAYELAAAFGSKRTTQVIKPGESASFSVRLRCGV